MIITITNNKGGVGKSTTAQTLAIGLILKGFKVLLVDIDTQCSTTSTFNMQDDNKNVYEVLKGHINIKDAIKHADKLDFLASSILLKDADNEFTKGAYEFKRHKLLAEQLNQVKAMYDYIIIDTAPNLSLMTTNAIYSSNSVIIPLIADAYSIEGLQVINNQINAIKEGTDNKAIYIEGLLLTNYKGQTTINAVIKDALENIAKQINTKLYKSTIRDSIIFSDSQLKHSVCLLKYPKHKATNDYNEFIKEFIKDTKNNRGGNNE